MNAWLMSLAVFSALATGCVSVRPVTTAARADSTEREVRDRNYTLGFQRSAVVGDAMLRLRAYTLVARTTFSPHITVNEPCHVRIPLAFKHTFNPGDIIDVIGETACDEGSCRLIRLVRRAGANQIGARISPDGRMVGVPINLDFNNKMMGSLEVTPETCRFIPVESTQESVDSSASYRNFEILYGGLDADAMRFTYREYTADDLARPAYTQTFSYPMGSSEIRFKDVTIAITEARSDSIRYTVVDDGG